MIITRLDTLGKLGLDLHYKQVSNLGAVSVVYLCVGPKHHREPLQHWWGIVRPSKAQWGRCTTGDPAYSWMGILIILDVEKNNARDVIITRWFRIR